MHPHFSLRLLASFCLLIASIFSTSGYGNESPSSKRFSAAANKPVDQFVCGTYRGNEMESMWHYCHYQNALKKQLAIPAADFVSDDVWVVEDDGLILQSGVNTFDTDKRIR